LNVKDLKTENTFYQLKSAEKWIKMNKGRWLYGKSTCLFSICL
jgi:hypothetical protein